MILPWKKSYGPLPGLPTEVKQKRRGKRREKTREELLQADVVEKARKFGWLVFHDYDSRRNAPGLPDLILVHPEPAGAEPAVLFVELKSEDGAVRDEQAVWLAALGKCRRVEVSVVRPHDLPRLVRRLAAR